MTLLETEAVCPSPSTGVSWRSIRWLTAFLDRPAPAFDLAVAFWLAATGSSLSPARGDRNQFATLIPGDGDPYLRLQRVDAGPGGSHLDLHLGDIDSFALRAVAAGAEQLHRYRDVVVLRSPAGLPWCAVRSHGEAVRPQPRSLDNGGSLHLVDQACIDVPNDRFDDECAFWSGVTGWEQQRSSVRPEFRYLLRPEGLPLRLLLQRRHDADGPARAHLDFATGDVDALAAAHEELGAKRAAVFDHWTVMDDPSGHPYCVTARDPHTGVLRWRG